MNEKTKWIIITIVIIIILGTLLHFTHEWSNDNQFVGYFSAVNESVWEHLKLIIFPVIITCFIQLYFNRIIKNFWTAMMLGIVIGMILITAIFYTYTGAISGDSIVAVDLLTFVFTAIIVAIVINVVFRSNRKCSQEFEILSFLIIIGIVGFVFYATYHPPNLPIFVSSV